jgi:hypothetical protein
MRSAAEIARETEELRRRIGHLELRAQWLNRPISAGERDALGQAQTRADSVAALFGERVSGPTTAETSLHYRARLLRNFLQHSPQFQSTHVEALDPASLSLVENQVYADAAGAARNTANSQPGVLIPRITMDAANRPITRYDGDMMAWLAPLMADGARCKINRDPGGSLK